MGKSLGNIIDPSKLLKNYGEDSVRWYLLRDIQFGQDGDFQNRRFVDIVNNDLANTIGNLLNRSSSMSRKWFDNRSPLIKSEMQSKNTLSQLAFIAIELENKIPVVPARAIQWPIYSFGEFHMRSFNLTG